MKEALFSVMPVLADTSALQLSADAVSLANSAAVIATAMLLGRLLLAEREQPDVNVDRRTVLNLIFAGQMFWVLEVLYSLIASSANAPRLSVSGSGFIFFLINACVASAFYFAGRKLLGMGDRMHSSLRTTSEGVRIPDFVSRPITSRMGGVGFLVLALLAICMALILKHGCQSPDHVVDIPNAIISFIGMAVLGLGLLRELARDRFEWVSGVCAGSVLAYAVVQLWRTYPPHIPAVLVVALIFKVTFFTAIVSYWTMITEMVRSNNLKKLETLSALRDMNDFRADMHDLVQGRINLANILLDGALTRVHDKPSKATKYIRKARKALLEGNQMVRKAGAAKLVSDLSRQLNTLCAEFSVAYHPMIATAEVRLQTLKDGPVAEALFAVAAESLENAARHSKAKRVKVSVSESDGMVTMQVSDDGKGMGEEDGFGISSMRVRMRSVQGELRVDSMPTGGTAIHACCPSGVR